ncbi:hypothetical protein MP228_010794 [Amoeboaphelidium protococcarum]|nr:hypothetical protein MP228_010794 [Amoeboaphelidium protococcarum]
MLALFTLLGAFTPQARAQVDLTVNRVNYESLYYAANGRTYMCSTFTGKARLQNDVTSATNSFIGKSDKTDIMLEEYDANGQLIFRLLFGGTKEDYEPVISIDEVSGRLYLAATTYSNEDTNSQNDFVFGQGCVASSKSAILVNMIQLDPNGISPMLFKWSQCISSPNAVAVVDIVASLLDSQRIFHLLFIEGTSRLTGVSSKYILQTYNSSISSLDQLLSVTTFYVTVATKPDQTIIGYDDQVLFATCDGFNLFTARRSMCTNTLPCTSSILTGSVTALKGLNCYSSGCYALVDLWAQYSPQFPAVVPLGGQAALLYISAQSAQVQQVFYQSAIQSAAAFYLSTESSIVLTGRQSTGTYSGVTISRNVADGILSIAAAFNSSVKTEAIGIGGSQSSGVVVIGLLSDAQQNLIQRITWPLVTTTRTTTTSTTRSTSTTTSTSLFVTRTTSSIWLSVTPTTSSTSLSVTTTTSSTSLTATLRTSSTSTTLNIVTSSPSTVTTPSTTSLPTSSISSTLIGSVATSSSLLEVSALPTSLIFSTIGSTSIGMSYLSASQQSFASYQSAGTTSDLGLMVSSSTPDASTIHSSFVSSSVMQSSQSDKNQLEAWSSLTLVTQKTTSSHAPQLQSSASILSTLSDPITFGFGQTSQAQTNDVQFSLHGHGSIHLSLSRTTYTVIVGDGGSSNAEVGNGIPFVMIAIASFVGLMVVLLMFALMLLYRRRRQQQKKLHSSRLALQSSVALMNSGNANGGDTYMNTTIIPTNDSIYGANKMSIPGYLAMIPGVHFTIVKKISEGGFGTVYEGRLTSLQHQQKIGSDLCAIKVEKSLQLPPDQRHEQDAAFLQEVMLLNLFEHNPNIVSLVGFSTNPNTIVMKVYSGGSLSDLLFAPQTVDLYSITLMVSLFKDLLNALVDIHKAKVVHLDLKPGNVLLSFTNTNNSDKNVPLSAVLCDFGAAKLLVNSQDLIKGFQKAKLQGVSLQYAAPEYIQRVLEITSRQEETADVNHTSTTMFTDINTMEEQKIDIYALGVVAYEMFIRQKCWTIPAQDVVVQVQAGVRPLIPQQSPLQSVNDPLLVKTIIDLIQRMWHQEAVIRPTAEEVLSIISPL